MSALERLTKVRLENVCSELFEAIEECFISRDKAPEHISLFDEHKYSKRILDQISGSLEARPMYEEWEALEHGALEILESFESFSGCFFYVAAKRYLFFNAANVDQKLPPPLCVLYVISRHLLFSLEAGKLNEQKMFITNLMIDRFIYWCVFFRSEMILKDEKQRLKERIGGRPKDSVKDPKYRLIVEELKKMKSEGFQIGRMSMEYLVNEIRKRNLELGARAPSTLKKQLTKIKKDVDTCKIFC